MDWDTVGFVKASQIRMDILKRLDEKPMSPKELKHELSIHFPQVSLTLKQMYERKLIECLTSTCSKGKIYAITDNGREILKEI